jgi:kumamolisin
VIRKLFLSSLAVFAFSSSHKDVSQAQTVMTRHLRESTMTGQARITGRVASTQSLSLDLVLAVRDPQGLSAFLEDLYNPASPSFHQYLTPAEFTARFGPTQADYDAVVAFANRNGLAITGGSRDGMDLQVKASAAAVESAMHISLHTYQHPTENRSFYAPDREPTLDLPFSLWHISGLDNYSIPHPLYVKKSDYAKANGLSAANVVAHSTTGSGPQSSFLGSDMRAAYYGTGSLTGTGQNLGLWEYVGTNLADLTTYYKNINQTNKVPVTLLSVDGTPTSCVYTAAGGNCDDTEQNLDLTQALGMAPGLANLTMYIGSSDTAIAAAMTTHSPLPTTIGCSWGWTPVDPTTLDPYFQKMAAQGQNFFAASGDSSTWSTKNEAWPADDPYVVAVGGTDLVTSGAAGKWASETAWADSGGGITPDNIAIPSWQKLNGVITSANKGSSTLRNGPDVSANANFTFYTCSNQSSCLANEYGGTSFAAPMWAGYLALVNQQLANTGKPTVGFINPTIYAQNAAQNVTSAYATNFHDITTGTSGSYSATTGYDLVTGWGSPNTGLLAALTGGTTTQTPAFTITASPTSVSVTAAATASVTATTALTTAVSGGFSSAVALTATGQPAGVTVAFSPTSIASPGSGSSTATFTVAPSTAAGTYSITLTGAGGNLTSKTAVNLTVAAAPKPAFTLTPSATSVAVTETATGSVTGSATLTTALSGGFSSAIALTATGQPSGVTVAFSPALIASPGSGSSKVTFTVASSTPAGSYAITLTGTGAGITTSTKLSLAVAAAAKPAFTLTASPASVSIIAGGSSAGTNSTGTATLTTAVSGGFSSSVALTASGQPNGLTVAFSPASIAAPGSGTAKATFTAASTVPAGTYTIAITATGGGITNKTTVTLAVTSPSFTLSSTPGSGSLARGTSGTGYVATTATGGFNSSVALTATGQPAGVTVVFSPSTIPAPGAATVPMKITVATTATVGTYPITITATGGGKTRTTTLSLTVTKGAQVLQEPRFRF